MIQHTPESRRFAALGPQDRRALLVLAEPAMQTDAVAGWVEADRLRLHVSLMVSDTMHGLHTSGLVEYRVPMGGMFPAWRLSPLGRMLVTAWRVAIGGAA